MQKNLEKNNTFSIIMPTWNRETIIPKAINSILDQTYPHWELIIIDDGSTDNTQEVLKQYRNNPKIKFIKHDKSRERIISWNEGMKMATNDWICFLDSDDEWMFGYLEIMNFNIEKYPEYKMFNFGQIVQSLTGSTFKQVTPLEEDDKEGMKHFDTGRVGAGGFIFKKECLDTAGYLPDIDNVFDFADWFGEKVKEYWKERGLEGDAPLYNKDDKWCGNPWGQDYVLAWLITRKFKTKPLFVYPYIAYIRTENWLYERATQSGVMGG